VPPVPEPVVDDPELEVNPPASASPLSPKASLFPPAAQADVPRERPATPEIAKPTMTIHFVVMISLHVDQRLPVAPPA
jgi:hypothetical protein